MHYKSEDTVRKMEMTASALSFKTALMIPITFANLAFRTGSWIFRAWGNTIPGMGNRHKAATIQSLESDLPDILLEKLVRVRKFGPKIHVR